MEHYICDLVRCEPHGGVGSNRFSGLKILNIFFMVRGGDQKNDMAGYEDIVYILGRGKTKLDSFWGVISMQFWVLF